jgi:hypothetical protein
MDPLKEVIMKRLHAVRLALLALLCAGLVAGSPAGATTPTTQTISLVRAFPGGPPAGWSTTGPLFSDSGQWTVDRLILGGLPAPTEGAINFFITATGSQGTIEMRFLLDFNQSQEQDLCWIVGGTGDYADLRGQGTFTLTVIGGQPHIDCTAALHFN